MIKSEILITTGMVWSVSGLITRSWLGNETDPFPGHEGAHDDDDDDDQEVNRTQPFQPGDASKPYHPGEKIEVHRLPDEQSALPETSSDEDL